MNTNKNNQTSIVVQDIRQKSQQEFPYSDAVFFSNNDQYLYLQIADTLLVIDNKTNRILERLPATRLTGNAVGNDYLIYFTGANSQTLVLHRLGTNKQETLEQVSNAYVAPGGQWMALTQNRYLKLLNIATRRYIVLPDTIADTRTINNLQFSSDGNRLAYVLEQTTSIGKSTAVWLYDIRSGRLQCLYQANTFRDNPCTLTGHLEFSANGKWVFFDIETSRKKTPAGPSKVTVWSYKDQLLEPEHRRIWDPRKTSDSTLLVTYKGIISLKGDNAIFLEQDEELETFPKDVTGNHLLVRKGYSFDTWLPSAPDAGYLLIDLNSGTRFKIKGKHELLFRINFSKNGDHLIYWDLKKGDHFIYDIKQGTTTSLNSLTQSTFSNYHPGDIYQEPVSGLAGWLQDGSAFFMYDQYDIWMIPLARDKKPVNITGQYGRKKQLMFRFLPFGDGQRKLSDKNILLSAYDANTKESGFYKLSHLTGGTTIKLSMGPYSTSRTYTQVDTYAGEDIQPVKAIGKELYVVCRQSAVEAPNFYLTSDFVRFTPLTDFNPHKNVNWLTTELIKWKNPDGIEHNAILYKPTDFDSSRQYPLIIHYYELQSNKLYQFPRPEFMVSNINIPYFASNGYLLLDVDMTFSNASQSDITTGEHARLIVESAIDHLSKRTYLNRSRIGLSGHSFGGHLTNYIISHSRFPFAAASEAAGYTDVFWAYLSLIKLVVNYEHAAKLAGVETGNGRMGATPWERPDLYLRSSTVWHADKIKTPLLIMHNKGDNQIPWNQGVALYLALTRLQKKVWLLEYEKGSHVLYGTDAVDYTLRNKQFFDYYLQDSLPPRWMTSALPEDKLNKNQGFEFDRSGRTP